MPNFRHKYTYDRYYFKESFPIILAYAMTNHKSQGATIFTEVIIDMKQAFTLNITYVMFFKVINRINLR